MSASAIGSNMFEGFVPTQGIVELFRDYIEGKISRAAKRTINKYKIGRKLFTIILLKTLQITG